MKIAILCLSMVACGGTSLEPPQECATPAPVVVTKLELPTCPGRAYPGMDPGCDVEGAPGLVYVIAPDVDAGATGLLFFDGGVCGSVRGSDQFCCSACR